MNSKMIHKRAGTTHTTIFISSTFLDMKTERNIMRHYGLPMLNSVANEYGESVSLCDLRWGIDTEALDETEATKKVLNVCLDEIDHCSPPVIVFLGNRYGWIPGTEAVSNIASTKNFQLDDYSISMTDLEVRYNFFRGTDALYYFKMNPDQPEDNEKLSRLKQDIIQNKNIKICEYTPDQLGPSFEDHGTKLGEIIYQDLLAYFLPKWQQNSLSPEETVQKRHAQFFKEKAAQFSARLTDRAFILDRVNKKSTVILQGKAGSGKSTMMGRLAKDLKKKGYYVIPIECGLTENSSTSYEVLCLINNALLNHFKTRRKITEGSSIPAISQEKSLLSACLALAEKRKEYIAIVVDAVDQLTDITGIEELPFFQTKQTIYTRFIISCSSDIQLKTLESYHLQPMDYDDKMMVIKSMLDYYGKEVNPAVIDAMTINPMSANPMYLNMMMQMLLITDIEEYEQIIDEQKKLITDLPHDIDLLSVQLLRTIGRRINPVLSEKIVRLFACSRYGQRDMDLERIISKEWNYIDFILLLNHSREFFIKRSDGRYDFVHRCFRNGFRKQCDLSESRKQVLETLCRTDENDPIRKSEYIYHVIAADQKQMFADILREDAKKSKPDEKTVQSVYHACLEDSGKWIIDYLSKITNDNDMLYAFRFLIYGLLPHFSNTLSEMNTIIRISDMMIHLLCDERYKVPLEKYQEMLLSMFEKGAKVADNLHDKSRTVTYAFLFFKCGRALCDSGHLDNRRRFNIYYNTLVFLKTYGHLPEVREHFFRIADEGLSNGAYDNGPSELKGPYWGCIGEVYGRIDNYDKQREAYYQDLELRQKAYDGEPTDSNHVLLSGAFGNVAFTYMVRKEYGDAIDYYRKSLEILENYSNVSNENEMIRVLGANYFNIAQCYLGHASVSKQYLTCCLQSVDYMEKWIITDLRFLHKRQVPAEQYQQLIENYNNHIRRIVLVDGEHCALYLQRAERFTAYLNSIIRENTEDIQPLPAVFSYSGESYKGLPHGHGILITPDGYTYEGQFVNGFKEGYGVLTWDNGASYYKGLWSNDLRDVFGETVAKSGFSYIGEWSKGKINGYGKKEKDNNVTYGVWKMGSFQKNASKLVVRKKTRDYQRMIKKLKA